MGKQKRDDLEITCPCCGAKLQVDAELGKVLYHEPPPKSAKAPDLGQANEFLAQQAAKREALFKQSAEDEKVKSQLLERKFEEALKKKKDEPVTRPLRDFDLD